LLSFGLLFQCKFGSTGAESLGLSSELRHRPNARHTQPLAASGAIFRPPCSHLQPLLDTCTDTSSQCLAKFGAKIPLNFQAESQLQTSQAGKAPEVAASSWPESKVGSSMAKSERNQSVPILHFHTTFTQRLRPKGNCLCHYHFPLLPPS